MPHTNEQVTRAAAHFIAVLARWLTEEEFTEFCRKTREDFQEDSCHSHDYCDANMAMQEAMKELGFNVWLADGHMDPVMVELWNDAWGRAKRLLGKGTL